MELGVLFFCDLSQPCYQLLSFIIRAVLCVYCWVSLIRFILGLFKLEFPSIIDALVTLRSQPMQPVIWLVGLVAGGFLLIWHVICKLPRLLYWSVGKMIWVGQLPFWAISAVWHCITFPMRLRVQYQQWYLRLSLREQRGLDALLQPFATRKSQVLTFFTCLFVGLFVPFEGYTSIPRELYRHFNGEQQFCITCCLHLLMLYILKVLKLK